MAEELIYPMSFMVYWLWKLGSHCIVHCVHCEKTPNWLGWLSCPNHFSYPWKLLVNFKTMKSPWLTPMKNKWKYHGKQVLWEHHEDLVIYPWKYHELQNTIYVVKVPWKLAHSPLKTQLFFVLDSCRQAIDFNCILQMDANWYQATPTSKHKKWTVIIKNEPKHDAQRKHSVHITISWSISVLVIHQY